jgi:hypothetical protein
LLKAENNVLIFTGSIVKMPFQVMKTDNAAVVSARGFVGATGIGVGKKGA